MQQQIFRLLQLLRSYPRGKDAETNLIARSRCLAGKVIASPEPVAKRIDCVRWRFAALRHRRRLASLRSGCFDHGVVLALARMFLVARDQEGGMDVTISQSSKLAWPARRIETLRSSTSMCGIS